MVSGIDLTRPRQAKDRVNKQSGLGQRVLPDEQHRNADPSRASKLDTTPDLWMNRREAFSTNDHELSHPTRLRET